MSVEKLIPDLRAGLRQHLLDTTVPAVTIAATTSITSNYLSAPGEAGLDFTTLFSAGEYLTLSGAGLAAGNARYRAAERVDAQRLQFALANSFTSQSLTGLTVTASLPPFAWEGESYEPDPGTPYISETFGLLDSTVSPMGGIIKHKLALILTLFFPAHRGTLGLDRLSGRLQQRLKPGTTIRYGSNAGLVEKCQPKPLLKGPEWIQCALTASVTAWTLNQ